MSQCEFTEVFFEVASQCAMAIGEQFGRLMNAFANQRFTVGEKLLRINAR